MLGRTIAALLIDLDDTLYRTHEVPRLVREAIQGYMLQHLGYSEQDVASATTSLYLQHGTTLAGLVATGHAIDYDRWHQCVHHDVLDYQALLQPDVALRALLDSVPLPKYILTNADRHHASQCLERLGIADCFQQVFDFEWAQAAAQAHSMLTKDHPVMCKPQHGIYSLALQAIRCEPSQCLFLDDSARNVQAAHELGLITAIVGRDTLVPGADVALPTMHALPSVLPELLVGQADTGQTPQQQQALPKRQGSCQQPTAPVEVQHPGEATEPLAQLVAVAQGSGSISTR